jgi:hypothetical protein
MIVKILIILLLTKFAYADKYELTVTGDIKKNPSLKEENLIFKYFQTDENKKYTQEIEINYEKNYSLNAENSEFTKTSDMFDYQHEFNYFKKNNYFLTAYYRKNDDKYSNISNRNFSISTAGLGYKFSKDKRELLLQLTAGHRSDQENDSIIFIPKITFNDKIDIFTYKIKASFAKENNSEITNFDLQFSYPLNEILSLKYLFEFEESKNGITRIETLNRIALSLKFDYLFGNKKE